eukprot:264699-Lingulodinium_polyedra.AAC.1
MPEAQASPQVGALHNGLSSISSTGLALLHGGHVFSNKAAATASSDQVMQVPLTRPKHAKTGQTAVTMDQEPEGVANTVHPGSM